MVVIAPPDPDIVLTVATALVSDLVVGTRGIPSNHAWVSPVRSHWEGFSLYALNTYIACLAFFSSPRVLGRYGGLFDDMVTRAGKREMHERRMGRFQGKPGLALRRPPWQRDSGYLYRRETVVLILTTRRNSDRVEPLLP